MYEQQLSQIGLNKEQAVIYEIMLKNGSLTAGKIAGKGPFKRGVVYKILDQLVDLNLIEKGQKPGKPAKFSPLHPLKIKEMIKIQEQKYKDAQLILDGIMPGLSSDFNLITGKPNVRFFEGIEGIKEVLKDSLFQNPKKKILAFSDVAGYADYLKEWNSDYYAPQRKRLQIYEKAIIPNNQKALEFMKGYQANELTDVLFVDSESYPFSTEVNIYSDKISFVTFSKKTHIGVIVENKEVFETLTSIFDFCWEIGAAACRDIQPEWIKKPV